MSELMHGSCVALLGKAVLLLGDSGAGKSDLALRLIDRGAFLVADDQVELSVDEGEVYAAPPDSIAGKLEVRGVGIMALPYKSGVPLALVVRLVGRENMERLPEGQTLEVAGVKVPLLALSPFDESTVAKIRLFLTSAGA